MAVSVIPLAPGNPFYNFNTVLGGVLFFFTVRWNSRDAAWYLDMYDSDDKLMIAGEKLVLGAYIGRKSSHEWFSVNTLACIDSTLDELDAGFNDLGSRILLQCYPFEDLTKELMAT